MSEKLAHTLCIFKNDAKKIFHIWQTSQKKFRQNVNITNAFSKASYALMGKDSSQPAATSTFLRVVASTDKEEWDVEYVEVGEVSKEELQVVYNEYSDVLTSLGYSCLTRDPRVRLQSGKYAGKKWTATKIENLLTSKVQMHVENMMRDCFVPDEIVKSDARKVAFYATGRNSEINNISELWSYVFNNYSEKAKELAE